ncbi:TIM-barrel protein, nifR3 family [Chloroherpeton thalassium ATCC 35110]|uniref:TIM-barrel protein, nifR3 family n=2 Tax=Chloroherpeton thalassium TaxID=100716 RepID=B3QWF2_CHLT3|nr:TIM-barrel protein, nifR3 family [Chloroherpeton thalassium ATCC 35110]
MRSPLLCYLLLLSLFQNSHGWRDFRPFRFIFFRFEKLYAKLERTMKIGQIEIEKPVILAPMEDVTDPSFRRLCKHYGADIVFTEFISSDGLIRHAVKSKRKLDVFDDERPVAIQIFGNQIEPMVEAAQMAEAAGPDFIDINYGCPAKKVAGKGAGSGLLCQPDLMEKITDAVVKAVRLPVTAKTRIGWDERSISILDTVRRLEGCGIQALSIHGRTRAQMYKGRADWSWIARAKEVATIPIIGNGDIWTAEDAKRMFDETGVDGVMIGRGAIGNPFLFREAKHLIQTGEHLPQATHRERVAVAIRHLEMSLERKGEKYGVLEMRRHYSTYLKGLPNVSKVRDYLVRENDPNLIVEALRRFEVECDAHLQNGTFQQFAQHLNDHSKRLVLSPPQAESDSTSSH